jgi:hypothetical protein
MVRRNKIRSVRYAIAMAVSLLCLLLSIAVPITKAAHRESPPAAGAGRALARFVIADFDGDEKPDYVTVDVNQSHLHLTDYSIRLRLSRGFESAIGITAPSGGLQLSSRDVNGDNILDVVVRTALDSNLVAVLINDGNGNFSLAKPELFPGLQNEAAFHFNGEIAHVPEQVLTLPSRSLNGVLAENVCERRLKNVSEPRQPEGKAEFSDFSYQSDFGRSPPECR